MAGDRGPQAHPLIARLAEEATATDFFRAIRLVDAAFATMPRAGSAQRAVDEPVRLGQEPSLAFAPSTLARCIVPEPREGPPNGFAPRPRLLVHFLGLLGPNGPMPLHITEYVRDRARNADDPTLARFLDIFHHRILALFYRAWAASQQAVSYDRPAEDRFGFYVASLFGLGPEAMRQRDQAPDLAKLHYAGRLSCQTRNPEGLASLLSDFFGVPVALEEFVGQWQDLEEPRRLRLGHSRATGVLGATSIVGARIWDRNQKFRLRLGPMDFESYSRFLPVGRSLSRLAAWVRNYIGDELDFDVRLVLAQASVPQTRLGQQGRLGWSTWISAKPLGRDADDLVLRPGAAAGEPQPKPISPAA
jgi:type VI secretion system protein ImpH